MTKAQLRVRLLRQLQQQEEDDRRRRSQAIWRRASRLRVFRRAKTICCYVALPYEVQTWQMIERMLERGKRVVVPRVQRRARRLQCCEIRDPSTELMPGAFGVWEPVRSARRFVRLGDLDLVFVPGLAFDRRGHRLGHGGGYFDRFLARVPRTTPTIGLAFRFQLLDRLPVAPHDRALHAVIAA